MFADWSVVDHNLNDVSEIEFKAKQNSDKCMLELNALKSTTLRPYLKSQRNWWAKFNSIHCNVCMLKIISVENCPNVECDKLNKISRFFLESCGIFKLQKFSNTTEEFETKYENKIMTRAKNLVFDESWSRFNILRLYVARNYVIEYLRSYVVEYLSKYTIAFNLKSAQMETIYSAIWDIFQFRVLHVFCQNLTLKQNMNRHDVKELIGYVWRTYQSDADNFYLESIIKFVKKQDDTDQYIELSFSRQLELAYFTPFSVTNQFVMCYSPDGKKYHMLGLDFDQSIQYRRVESINTVKYIKI